MNTGLWVAQSLIFLSFTIFGFMKMFMPVQKLGAMWVWPAQVPAWFLRGMGVIDLVGGLGILLPALLNIQPQLTPVAAIACTVLQVCAIVFHAVRKEFQALPINVILLALCAFIVWGRVMYA